MWECGEAQSLQEAKSVHEHIIRSLSPLEVSTYNRIMEMYGKCGSMEDAFMVFNAMSTRNLTSWDTMMTWIADAAWACRSRICNTQLLQLFHEI